MKMNLPHRTLKVERFLQNFAYNIAFSGYVLKSEAWFIDGHHLGFDMLGVQDGVFGETPCGFRETFKHIAVRRCSYLPKIQLQWAKNGHAQRNPPPNFFAEGFCFFID